MKLKKEKREERIKHLTEKANSWKTRITPNPCF